VVTGTSPTADRPYNHPVTRRLLLAAIGILPVVLMVPSVALAQDSSGPIVTISDFQFTPASINVAVGSTVTWRNDGPSTHTATANDSSFNTGLLKNGQSESATFNQLGSFEYVCTLHPQMTGTVVVESVGSAVDDAPTSTEPEPGAEQPDSAQPEATDQSAKKHPSTGAELGIQLLLGVGLLLIGANARRFVRPAARF
jgi:plastocyanin